MKLDEFISSLDGSSPPEEAPPLLKALWHDSHDDWERAHDIAQDIATPMGARVHAYLHRKEGDLWNADYWYRRADAERPASSLEEEWQSLVDLLVEG